MRKFVLTLLIVVMMLTLTGFNRGPTTHYDASIAEAGEEFVFGGSTRGKQVTIYVKCISGTILAVGQLNGENVSRNYGDAETLISEGDIIPLSGKFNGVRWEGVGATAEGVLYVYEK